MTRIAKRQYSDMQTLRGRLNRKAQDEAIAKVTGYLRVIHNRSRPPAYSLILEHGMACYTNRHSFDGPLGERGMCYMNSFHAVIEDPSLTYMEGFCSTMGIPIQHAWCLNRKGKVIETTLPNAEGYFGIPFQWDYVRRTAIRTRLYGIISFTNDELFSTPPEQFVAKVKNGGSKHAKLSTNSWLRLRRRGER